jgi:hypothetical protein
MKPETDALANIEMEPTRRLSRQITPPRRVAYFDLC